MKLCIAIIFCIAVSVEGLEKKDVAVRNDQTSNWVLSKGWCQNCQGRDQNAGVIELQDDLTEDECLRACERNSKAVGCEWANNYVCTIHTREVLDGNGDRNYKCWAARQNCQACDSGIATTGGNAGGACCHFPFYYNRVEYTACATEGHSKPWCFTDHNNSEWGECVHDCKGGTATTGGNAAGACCTGPCIADNFRPWCYTNAEESKWGYCVSDEWQETRGYCFGCYDRDQNEGTIQLQDDMTKTECLQACKRNSRAKGCEWAITKVCTIHTREVSRGSGDYGYKCWSSRKNCQGLADEQTADIPKYFADQNKETVKSVNDEKIPAYEDEAEEFFEEQK